MDDGLEISINGAPVTAAEVEAWEVRRAKAVLSKLKAPSGGGLGNLGSLRAELLQVKEQLGRQALRDSLRRELFVSELSTKAALLISGKGRKQCVTEIRVAECSARHVADAVDDLMRNDTTANRHNNLLACPDHYLLEPRGDILEVIETTGGSPLAARFFMRFEDESGLVAPRDPAYAFQSAGTARLGDGTVIGGVRHQFRDEGDDAVARLMVEFPAATPGRMIREHQWHLACEFSHWLREAKGRAERAT